MYGGLDLTYKLVDLKIKSKAPDQIYFMSRGEYFRNIGIIMTKGKNKEMKIAKIYLLLLPPLPFRDGGLLQLQPPTFFTAKILGKKFIDAWVSGQRVGKLTEWQS